MFYQRYEIKACSGARLRESMRAASADKVFAALGTAADYIDEPAERYTSDSQGRIYLGTLVATPMKGVRHGT